MPEEHEKIQYLDVIKVKSRDYLARHVWVELFDDFMLFIGVSDRVFVRDVGKYVCNIKELMETKIPLILL